MADPVTRLDDELLNRLLSIAIKSLGASLGAGVRVTGTAELIILSGIVDHRWQSDIAEFVVLRAGPRQVRNEIIVRES